MSPHLINDNKTPTLFTLPRPKRNPTKPTLDAPVSLSFAKNVLETFPNGRNRSSKSLSCAASGRLLTRIVNALSARRLSENAGGPASRICGGRYFPFVIGFKSISDREMSSLLADESAALPSICAVSSWILCISSLYGHLCEK